MKKTKYLEMIAVAFVTGFSIESIRKKVAPHKIGQNQTALRWIAVIGGAALMELAATQIEKHYGATAENSDPFKLFI